MAKKVIEMTSRNVVTCKKSEIEIYFKVFGNRSLLALPGSKFAYFMEKNYSILDTEIKKHQKYNSEQIDIRGKLDQKYLDAEKEVLEQYCARNEKNEPVIKNGMYSITDIEEFKKSKAAIIKKSKIFTKEDLKVEKYNKAMDAYMDTEVTFEFRKINEDDLPQNLSGEQRIIIKDFII
jgi:hypothetical protein